MNNEFVKLNENDQFSKFRGYDLQDLIVQVENSFLEYRKSLDLPCYITFGTEIEYEDVKKILLDYFISENMPRWKSKSDMSLDSGGEITSPIMYDEAKYWDELKLVCDYLTDKHATTNNNAGGHIHIGSNVLSNNAKQWRLFLKLYIAYENVLLRFFAGDKINPRNGIDHYAPPVANKLYNILYDINGSYSFPNLGSLFHCCSKFNALNLEKVSINPEAHYNNTIEFRSPNATSNAIIWQNNINACTKMLDTCGRVDIDEDFLDNKIKNEFVPYKENKYLYGCINFKNVLEFVDIIFDNNLDKIYFLRQYLKNFQEVYDSKHSIKAKSFVKRR